MKVRPDGFIGMVMGIEGISDATTLMHGPDGCRKNLTVLSSKCYPRGQSHVDMSTPFYRGMPRIPCTGVVSSDYIFGSYRKVVDALTFLKDESPGLIVIVSTPGASLIGDDCQKAIRECGMEDIAMAMDADPISHPLGYGFDRTMSEIASKLAVTGTKRKRKVNVLGVNVLVKDWPTVVEEFSHMLSLMGLEVGCFLGAGCSVEEIRQSGSAEFNIVLLPEYAERTAETYTRLFGTPSVSPGFAPVGFDATAEWLEHVAEAIGTDCSAALEYVAEMRSRAYRCMLASRNSVRGESFAVDAEASVACPLTKWLMESFSMVPCSITMPPGGCEASIESLSTFLEERSLVETIGAEAPGFADVILCDGNTARLKQGAKLCRKGIDISFPSISNVDFRRSPVFGPSGALYLLDRLMNP